MAIATLGALVVYVVMWAGFVLDWVWFDAVDNTVLKWLHDFGAARPGWRSFWIAVSIALAPRVFQAIGAVWIVVGLVRRQYRTALFLLVGVELMALVLVGAKWLVERPRPSTAFVYDPSTSFPSGHAFSAMVGVLVLGTLLWPSISPRWRASLITFGTALILLVGFARVALNVHHPSDVVAGWALGFVYYQMVSIVFSRARGIRRDL